jgi:hypothetical protein
LFWPPIFTIGTLWARFRSHPSTIRLTKLIYRLLRHEILRHEIGLEILHKHLACNLRQRCLPPIATTFQCVHSVWNYTQRQRTATLVASRSREHRFGKNLGGFHKSGGRVVFHAYEQQPPRTRQSDSIHVTGYGSEGISPRIDGSRYQLWGPDELSLETTRKSNKIGWRPVRTWYREVEMKNCSSLNR